MKFFKLARQITESAIWDDGTPFDKAHAWIDLLMYVNWADGERPIRGEILKIKRGSQFTSDKFLANRWHWSRNRTRRFLDTLERAGMITVNRTSIGTWINVVNYSKFQDKRTGSGTGNGTRNGTSDGTGGGTQLKKNIDEVVEEGYKNFLSAAAQKKIPPARSDVEEYCRQKNYHIDLTEFFSYYDLHDWTLGNGRKITNWTAAVDYWSNKGKKLETNEQTDMPYYQEFDNVEFPVASNIPFENGLASEVLKRKREKVSK